MPRAPVQPGRSARSWPVRGLLLSAAAFGLLTAGLNGRWLLAEAYSRYAQESISHVAAPAAALASAALALRLEPGNAGYQAARARAEQRFGSVLEAERLYAAALRSAPADAVLWRDYALIYARRGQYDAPLTHAVARAQALAPTSHALHLSLALSGLSGWAAADPGLYELWARSVAFQLRHSRNQFLRYVFATRQETRLCQRFKSDASLKEWCYWIPQARQTCYRSDLTPVAARRCERLGAYLGVTP